jgi:hypothetical protein
MNLAKSRRQIDSDWNSPEIPPLLPALDMLSLTDYSSIPGFAREGHLIGPCRAVFYLKIWLYFIMKRELTEIPICFVSTPRQAGPAGEGIGLHG